MAPFPVILCISKVLISNKIVYLGAGTPYSIRILASFPIFWKIVSKAVQSSASQQGLFLCSLIPHLHSLYFPSVRTLCLDGNFDRQADINRLSVTVSVFLVFPILIWGLQPSKPSEQTSLSRPFSTSHCSPHPNDLWNALLYTYTYRHPWHRSHSPLLSQLRFILGTIGSAQIAISAFAFLGNVETTSPTNPLPLFQHCCFACRIISASLY